ncbi:hypothetical protein [Methylobacterium sp. D54C]
MNLISGALVLLAWACLLSWTGTSRDGWQARTCSNLAVAPRACAELSTAKDQSRVAQHKADFEP